MITSDRTAPRIQIINTAALRRQKESLVPISGDMEVVDEVARMLPVDTAELRCCTGDEKAFIADVWGKRVHVTTGGIAAGNLISVRDIDRLLTSQPLLRSDMIRLVRQGEILPRNAYLRSMREVYPRPVDYAMTENENLFEMLTRGVASAAEVTAAVRGGATLKTSCGSECRSNPWDETGVRSSAPTRRRTGSTPWSAHSSRRIALDS